MAELEKRLSELSPDQRETLRRLLKERAQKGAAAQTHNSQPTSEAALPESLVLDNSSPSEPAALKASYKKFYDGVSKQLNATVFGQFSYFLNYGYVPDGQPEFAAIELPEHYINKNSVKLVLEVIQDCPVEAKRILDVGCGRGGTIHVLNTFFKPAKVVGLDLSTAAIEFCRATHRGSHNAFHEGDAENLPFEAQSFDVVTNLESSHSYPHIDRFYSEVFRVLIPGGYFLYTDALELRQLANNVAFLKYLGFEIERERDITANVLRSCDEVARNRVQAFDSRNDGELMQNFLATPGSNVYQEMQSGHWSYRIWKLRKQT